MAQAANTARRIHWDRTDDDDGFKTYMARYLVRITLPSPLSSSTLPGPQIASGDTGAITGLPTVGLSYWTEGADNDISCICLRPRRIQPAQVQDGDPHEYFTIEYQFSNRPQVLDPSQDPSDPTNFGPTFSGSFVSDSFEARFDKDSNAIHSSSLEPIKGPTNQWDRDNPTVVIEQNSLELQLSEITDLKNKVSASAIWGLDDARTVKAKPVTWQRRWSQQVAGGYYFARRFEFEIDLDGFDRDDIMDEGLKTLKGTWDADGEVFTYTETDWTDNANLIRATDGSGNLVHVLLDGYGHRVGSDNPQGGLGTITTPQVIPLIRTNGAVKVYEEFTNAELQALNINTDNFLLSTNRF